MLCLQNYQMSFFVHLLSLSKCELNLNTPCFHPCKSTYVRLSCWWPLRCTCPLPASPAPCCVQTLSSSPRGWMSFAFSKALSYFNCFKRNQGSHGLKDSRQNWLIDEGALSKLDIEGGKVNFPEEQCDINPRCRRWPRNRTGVFVFFFWRTAVGIGGARLFTLLMA